MSIDDIKIPGLDLKAFLNFTKDPHQTVETFHLIKAIKEGPLREESGQWTHQAALASPGMVAQYEEKYMPTFPTTEQLLTNPQGSLGHRLGEHLSTHNITLDFQGIDTSAYYNTADSISGFMGLKALRNHDALHVLLDRGVSKMDELAVAAFQLGQFNNQYHVAICSSIILHYTFSEPKLMSESLETYAQYYQWGQSVPLVFGYRFEDSWQTPLDTVKKKLELNGLATKT